MYETFDELKHTGKLPSPSSVGTRILVLTQNEDCPLDDIVSTIEVDPALTGRIIKLASSVQLGGVPVTTAKDAAIRLGLQAVVSTALGFSVVSGNRRGNCSAFDYNRFWSKSLATAVAAETIAREMGLRHAAEGFTLGLLLDVGRLALASVYPEEYAALLRSARGDVQFDFLQAESEQFFINRRQVAAALLQDWGLPADFSEVAVHFDGKTVSGEFEHERSGDLMRVMVAAVTMAEVCVSSPEEQAGLWPAMRRACHGVDVKPDQVCAIFDQVVEQWSEWGQALAVPTPTVESGADLEQAARERLIRAATQHAQSPLSSQQKLRILAVDDDPVSLRMLTALLDRNGHEVLTASNGKEAIAVYLEHGAQMVITDWMMPEMDGLTLCRQLRKMPEGRKLYILLLTGQAEEERIVEAFEAGADDYIVKPFKPVLLKARIQPACRVIHLQEEHDNQVHEKHKINLQLKLEKRKFKAAAMTDALTELPNRRHAMDRLDVFWSNSRRAKSAFSVIMLDIDFFKRVNDSFGHDVGDEVLKATAAAIQGVLRRGDMCARMGGEEFLVICPNTGTPEGALSLAERIREVVEENHIQFGTFDGQVTISLGIGVADDQVRSIDELLKMADEAVYEAKNTGRNRSALGQPPGTGRQSA